MDWIMDGANTVKRDVGGHGGLILVVGTHIVQRGGNRCQQIFILFFLTYVIVIS
jgi:hypothetical protein